LIRPTAAPHVNRQGFKAPGIGGGATHAGPPGTLTVPCIPLVHLLTRPACAGANVFVFNLPLNVDESALVQMFSRFGQIVSTRVCKDITTRQSKVIACI